jgi:hypothetical protein
LQHPSPTLDFKRRFATKVYFFAYLFICSFFASSSLFFFPMAFPPHHERLALYPTILNDER